MQEDLDLSSNGYYIAVIIWVIGYVIAAVPSKYGLLSVSILSNTDVSIKYGLISCAPIDLSPNHHVSLGYSGRGIGCSSETLAIDSIALSSWGVRGRF
jgi:hypothetical protein